MADYRKICNILIGELSEIIDKAMSTVSNAEDEILLEKEEPKILQLSKEDFESDE